jgi:hypothetical protein
MKSRIQFIIYKQIYERQDLDFMQKWAFMGWGLGHGPKSSAHSWALMKPREGAGSARNHQGRPRPDRPEGGNSIKIQVLKVKSSRNP